MVLAPSGLWGSVLWQSSKSVCSRYWRVLQLPWWWCGQSDECIHGRIHEIVCTVSSCRSAGNSLEKELLSIQNEKKSKTLSNYSDISASISEMYKKNCANSSNPQQWELLYCSENTISLNYKGILENVIIFCNMHDIHSWLQISASLQFCQKMQHFS